MRKRILLLLLLASVTQESFSSDNLLCLSLDWQVSIRCGMEHKFNRPLGIKWDAGVSLLGTLVADAFLVVYLLPEKYRWQVNICAGMPNAATLFTFNAAMVSFGGSILTRCKITEKVSIDLRVGEGFPLFFEKDKDIIRDINFPFDLWPDFTLGVSFRR